MSKCSRVCGLMDSSAATTKSTRSIPPTPASIFLINLSWPGTSTKPRRKSRARSRCANPKSMEIPRCFSSFNRSVSMPVKARTRAVLPWSICPAVPAMTLFIATILILLLVRQPVSAQSEMPTFRTGVADVRVDAQVVEGDHVVTGLTQKDFTVMDEGQQQEIVYFGRDSEPVSLVLLLDISGSMQRWIQKISGVAREALNSLRPGDRVAILVFGKRMEVHQDFSDNLAESARQIAHAVEDHDVGAGTAINLSVAGAADYIRKHARPEGRRAILILTDNLSIGPVPDEAAIRSLYAADAVLNAIVVGRAIRPGPPSPARVRAPRPLRTCLSWPKKPAAKR